MATYIDRKLFRVAFAHYTAAKWTPEEERLTQLMADLPAKAPLRVGRIDRWAVGRTSQAHVSMWTRQHLLSRLLQERYLLGLIVGHLSLGKAALPLPRAWQGWLRTQSIRLSGTRSTLLFSAQVLKRLAAGIARIVRLSTYSSPRASQPYAVAHGLSPLMLPSGNNKLDNFGQWFVDRCRKDEIKEFWFVDSSAVSTPLPEGAKLSLWPFPALDGGSRIRFTLQAAGLALRAGLALLAGRWIPALALSETVTAAYASRIDADQLPARTTFLNSDYICRPLWTYVTERAERPTTLTFYSTNTKRFECADQGTPAVPPGYQVMTWSNYEVWDKWQKEYIASVTDAGVRIDEVGPVPLTDNGAPINLPRNKPLVAIFDVQSFRASALIKLNSICGFYSGEASAQFLDDAIRVTQAAQMQAVVKRKRSMLHRNMHFSYRSSFNRLSAQPDIVWADPDSSAARLINEVDAVISMPYTSTALVARAMNKPTVFYDPTGKMRNHDANSHGIEVLDRPEDLESWLAGIGGAQMPAAASRH